MTGPSPSTTSTCARAPATELLSTAAINNVQTFYSFECNSICSRSDGPVNRIELRVSLGQNIMHMLVMVAFVGCLRSSVRKHSIF